MFYVNTTFLTLYEQFSYVVRMEELVQFKHLHLPQI